MTLLLTFHNLTDFPRQLLIRVFDSVVKHLFSDCIKTIEIQKNIQLELKCKINLYIFYVLFWSFTTFTIVIFQESIGIPLSPPLQQNKVSMLSTLAGQRASALSKTITSTKNLEAEYKGLNKK
jgi:hypothetical protein